MLQKSANIWVFPGRWQQALETVRQYLQQGRQADVQMYGALLGVAWRRTDWLVLLVTF